MNYSEVLRCYNSIEEFKICDKKKMDINENYKPLPIKVVDAICRNKLKLESSLKAYNENIKSLGEKYNVSMDITNIGQKRNEVEPTKLNDFDKDLIDILNLEVEEVDFKKITISDMKDYELSISDYETLMFMMEEE